MLLVFFASKIVQERKKKSLRLSIVTRVDVCEDEKCSECFLAKDISSSPKQFPEFVYFDSQNLHSRSSHHPYSKSKGLVDLKRFKEFYISRILLLYRCKYHNLIV